MLCHCRNMCVALRVHGFIWNSGPPRRNDNRSFRMAFGHCFVNDRAIIRAVGGHRSYPSIDLIEQLRDFRNVTHIVRRQFRSDNVMRARINTKMQLPPPAARPDTMFLIQPFALTINLEARAVDKKMQRFITTDPAWQDP